MAMATTTRASALMGLRCRACQLLQPADERYVCGDCYGPVEPEYDTASFDTEVLRDEIERGPRSLWRYAPLLPIAAPRSHFAVGWTPLIAAPRLGAAIGVSDLYLKDDSRNPSLSFQDRPVPLALARALELGLDTLAGASTGNLAAAAAAAALRNGRGAAARHRPRRRGAVRDPRGAGIRLRAGLGRGARRLPRRPPGPRSGDGRAVARDRHARRRRWLGRGHPRERRLGRIGE